MLSPPQTSERNASDFAVEPSAIGGQIQKTPGSLRPK